MNLLVKKYIFFFTPTPCTSLPLDGMAKNFFLHGYAKCMQFITSASILFLPPYTRGEKKKTFWSGLESNPDPLASQATTLATKPWLLRQEID